MHIGEMKGAIFDVDDTLLDNQPGQLGKGLHERSRFLAIREVGRRHSIPQLADISPQANLDAFLTAPVHSLPGAVWNYLYMSGLVQTPEIEPENPLFNEIVDRKNELHVSVLREEGREVPGAAQFVRDLGRARLRDALAIASSAIRRDVDIFLDMTDLHEYFPSDHIKTLESATHTKPHPELFNLAFESLGLPEEARAQVVAFEDDPRGIMSARAAGLYVCAITTRFSRDQLHSLEVAPDMIADSFAEFSELLGMTHSS